jgi:hypothetical protein
VHDNNNGLIYVVYKSTDNFYRMSAYNESTGVLKWTAPQSFIAATKPYITDSGSAVLLTSLNGIYGYTSAGEPAFISGYFLPLPKVGSAVLQLVNKDEIEKSTLDIPAKLASGDSVIYSMNLGW